MVVMKFHPSPYERATSLTDVAMGLLAAGMSLDLCASGGFRSAVWAWAFGLLSLSSLLGAAAHGFAMSERANTQLWMPINLSLGLALGMFVVGALNDLGGESAARFILPAMIALGFGFFLVTLWKPGTFMTFIAYEAAAMLFALGVYGYLFLAGSLAGAGWMLAGVIVTILAAAIQATGKPGKGIIWYFDNNGVFHVIQMTGMVLLWVGLRP